MRRFNNNRPYWFFLGWLHEFMGLIHAVSAHFLLRKCKPLGSKIRAAQKSNFFFARSLMLLCSGFWSVIPYALYAVAFRAFYTGSYDIPN